MPRVAVIGGCRTPFVKAGGVLAQYSFMDLGVHVVKSAVGQTGINPESIEEFVFGTVLVDTRAPNFAREIIFRAGLPPSICAHAVSNNCISGLVAVNMVSEGVLSGRIRCGLAGGSESMSRPALAFRPEAEELFLRLSRARSLNSKFALLAKYRPRMAIPIPPSPREPSTGLTMGQHCEITAQEFSIPRKVQDEIAFRSHQNGARAQRQGFLAEEIAPLGTVNADGMIRADTNLEKLSNLPPVFDRSGQGTITAGNSSPLTDGASVVCLMAEERARQENVPILGYIEGVEFAAIDPQAGLLMAPALALPNLLAKKGLKVDQIDLFEVHEAFGAQVAANLLVWEKGWSRFPNVRPIGHIPEEKLNVNGGSIAIGHPFAATGGRLILSALNQLKRTGKHTAVLSVCAAGAMACAVLLKRE